MEGKTMWFTVDNAPGVKRLAKWKRSIAVGPGREIFVPAVIGADERLVMLMVGWDGTPVLVDGGHLYVPISWMEREFPKATQLWDKIRENVRGWEGVNAASTTTS